MINQYIKIIKYLFIFIIIDVVALTRLFLFKFIYRYDIFNNIINDRNFVFTNIL